MTVKIPAHSARPDDDLGRVINESARKACINEFDMARAMTFFLEEIVVSMCRSKTVTIMGFGQFGPWPYQGKKESTKNMPMTCLPRFMAAEGFKNEVSTTAVPREHIAKVMENYRRNHATAIAKLPSKKRAFTALKHFRVQIDAQARAAAPSKG